MKIVIQKDKCISMFITALLAIAKTWKQTKCLLVDEWIKIMYIYIYIYHSAIKNNEILTFANNMDEPRGYYAKWNKSDKER